MSGDIAGADLVICRQPGRLRGEVERLEIDLVPGRERHPVEVEVEVRRGVGAAMTVGVPVRPRPV